MLAKVFNYHREVDHASSNDVHMKHLLYVSPKLPKMYALYRRMALPITLSDPNYPISPYFTFWFFLHIFALGQARVVNSTQLIITNILKEGVARNT